MNSSRKRVHRTTPPRCNLAHDLHDAVAVAAENPDGARDYILWRLDDEQNAKKAAKANQDRSSSESDSSNKSTAEKTAAIRERAEAAKGPIKANWLYAGGAATFITGDREGCQAWFDRVVNEFPKTPRAEFAMFLNARCAFSAYRTVRGSDVNADMPLTDETKEVRESRQHAVQLFEAFRKKYPRGRLDADALGWLGALAFDAQDYLKALNYYVAQAEAPGHPETLRSAIYNCERTLARIGSAPANETAYALIARHPRMAMAFTYLVLSAPEADNYDGKWDNPADVRKWRRATLPKIAAAVAKQKESYKSDDWQPRYLAMLVYAASGAGNQAQALQLSQIAPDKLNKSEDLLLARGIALQRANKTTEAIECFQTFLRTFPKSVMAPGVRVRLALALQDNHQAGLAVATLCELLPKPERRDSPGASPAKSPNEDDEEEAEGAAPAATPNVLEGRFTGSTYPMGEGEWQLNTSSVYPNLSGADEEQLHQMIDTLINFAPLTELAAAIDHPSFNDVAKRELRAIIAQRYLAEENFAEGRKFATAAAFAPDKLKLIDDLERLTNDKSSGAKEKAEAMMKTGDAWAAARGQLLRAPLDARIHLYHRAYAIPGLTRRDNGQALHYGKVEDQLDDRDELHHAARWWMRAARSAPGSEISAKARLKALEALPPIARASVYAEQRAREIKLEAVSREIYDKLRAESPKSEEAQRKAAYWSVPALPKSDESSDYIPGETGDTAIVSCEDDACSLGYPYTDNEAFQPLLAKLEAPTAPNKYKAEQNLEESVKALRQSVAALKPEDLLNTVKDLDDQLRTNVTGLTDAAAVNCFDDLVQFLSEKEISAEAARIYVNLRLDLLHRARFAEPDPGMAGEDKDETVAAEIDEAAKSSAFRNFQDYLDFCRIALVSGAVSNVDTDIKDPKDPEHPMTYPSRDFPRLEKMTREFLQKYPKSRKCEAAQFVLARSIYSLSCPYIYCVSVHIPGSDPSEEMFDIVKKSYQREPFKADRVMAALDQYRQTVSKRPLQR